MTTGQTSAAAAKQRQPGCCRPTTSLLAAATDVRDGLVVGLLFTGALRVSELCAADDADRHHEGRPTWLVITRKGGAQVRVPLETTVAELLDLYVAIRPPWTGRGPAPLIVDTTGNRIDRYDVTRLLRRLAMAASIPRPETVTPHSLRATAITDQKRRGLNAEDIQELSGHADIRDAWAWGSVSLRLTLFWAVAFQ